MGFTTIKLTQLILARLLCRPKGESHQTLTKRFSAWFENAEVATCSVLHALETLQSSGEVVLTHRLWQLTDSGRMSVLAFLGISESQFSVLPEKQCWKKLKNYYLLAKCLDIPPRWADSLSQKSALQGAILAKYFHLTFPDELPPTRWIDQLMMQAVETQTAKSAELSQVLLYRALERESINLPVVASFMQPPVELSSPTLARQILDAARQCPTGHFSEDKIFISHVFRYMQREAMTTLDEEAFKQALHQAHQQGWLNLGRADLVEAMDFEDILESEIAHLTATYHFIHL